METTSKYDKKVGDLVAKRAKEFSKSSTYLRLKKSFEEMEERGFLLRPKYTLPPIDTVGKYRFSSKSTQIRTFNKI